MQGTAAFAGGHTAPTMVVAQSAPAARKFSAPEARLTAALRGPAAASGETEDTPRKAAESGRQATADSALMLRRTIVAAVGES